MDTVHELEALLEKAKAAAVSLEHKVVGNGPTVPISTVTSTVASTASIAAPKVVAPVAPVAPAVKPAAPAARPAAKPRPAKTILIAGQKYAADGLTQEWAPPRK